MDRKQIEDDLLDAAIERQLQLLDEKRKRIEENQRRLIAAVEIEKGENDGND